MKFPGAELLLLAFGIVLMAAVCWTVLRGKAWMRVVAVFGAVIVYSCFAYSLGTGIERFRWTSGQEHWFRRYSTHLHALVGENKIQDLTNAIVLFDTRYRKDPENIKDVMYQILEIGPYYKESQ